MSEINDVINGIVKKSSNKEEILKNIISIMDKEELLKIILEQAKQQKIQKEQIEYLRKQDQKRLREQRERKELYENIFWVLFDIFFIVISVIGIRYMNPLNINEFIFSY